MCRLASACVLVGLASLSVRGSVWNFPEPCAGIRTLRTTSFALGIDGDRKGSLAWLRSCQSNRILSDESVRKPLFRLRLMPKGPYSPARVNLTADDAGSFSISEFDRGVRLDYSGFPSGVVEHVECVFTVCRGDNLVYCDFHVKTGGKWTLIRPTFPELPFADGVCRDNGERLQAVVGDAVFCGVRQRGGRFAMTAYELGPGEKADDALLRRIVEMADSPGGEGDARAPRVLFLGNSITGTGPANRWDGTWGMCASWPEKDYVHLVVRELERTSGARVSWRRRNLAEWERNLASYDLRKNLADEIAFKPMVVVIALGENVLSSKTEADRALFARKLRELAKAFAAPGVRIVIRSTFWPRPLLDGVMKDVASELGAAYVDLSDAGRDETLKALGSSDDEAVAAHPGDRGMRFIADRISAAIRNRKD